MLMVAMSPGGVWAFIGLPARVVIVKALKTGNWLSIIAALGAAGASAITAQQSCKAERCLISDMVAPNCYMTEYTVPIFGHKACRVYCVCPLGSTLWDHQDGMLPYNGTPTSDPEEIKDLLEEAAEKKGENQS